MQEMDDSQEERGFTTRDAALGALFGLTAASGMVLMWSWIVDAANREKDRKLHLHLIRTEPQQYRPLCLFPMRLVSGHCSHPTSATSKLFERLRGLPRKFKRLLSRHYWVRSRRVIENICPASPPCIILLQELATILKKRIRLRMSDLCPSIAQVSGICLFETTAMTKRVPQQ